MLTEKFSKLGHPFGQSAVVPVGTFPPDSRKPGFDEDLEVLGHGRVGDFEP